MHISYNNLYNAFYYQLYDICCRVVQKHHYFPHMLAAKEENGFALRKWYLHMTFNFSHYLRPILSVLQTNDLMFQSPNSYEELLFCIDISSPMAVIQDIFECFIFDVFIITDEFIPDTTK